MIGKTVTEMSEFKKIIDEVSKSGKQLRYFPIMTVKSTTKMQELQDSNDLWFLWIFNDVKKKKIQHQTWCCITES